LFSSFGMRFLRLLPTLGLLFGARASQLDSRVPHTLDTRELLDVCAEIKVDHLNINVLNILKAAGLVGASTFYLLKISRVFDPDSLTTDICLCLSALPLNIEAKVDAGLLAQLGGLIDINAILRLLVRRCFYIKFGHLCLIHFSSQINSSAAKDNCHFPDHSKPICADKKKCAFECTDGFIPSPQNNPTQCICPAPFQVCNGQCVAQGGCPSQKPRSDNRRRWLGSGSCAERGHGWLACGVYGNNPSAWECVNTARDLESCEFFFLSTRLLIADDANVCTIRRWWLRGSPHRLLSQG